MVKLESEFELTNKAALDNLEEHKKKLRQQKDLIDNSNESIEKKAQRIINFNKQTLVMQSGNYFTIQGMIS